MKFPSIRRPRRPVSRRSRCAAPRRRRAGHRRPARSRGRRGRSFEGPRDHRRTRFRFTNEPSRTGATAPRRGGSSPSRCRHEAPWSPRRPSARRSPSPAAGIPTSGPTFETIDGDDGRVRRRPPGASWPSTRTAGSRASVPAPTRSTPATTCCSPTRDGSRAPARALRAGAGARPAEASRCVVADAATRRPGAPAPRSAAGSRAPTARRDARRRRRAPRTSTSRRPRPARSAPNRLRVCVTDGADVPLRRRADTTAPRRRASAASATAQRFTRRARRGAARHGRADPSGLRAVKLSLTAQRAGRCQPTRRAVERFSPRACGAPADLRDRRPPGLELPAARAARRGRYVLDVDRRRQGRQPRPARPRAQPGGVPRPMRARARHRSRPRSLARGPGARRHRRRDGGRQGARPARAQGGPAQAAPVKVGGRRCRVGARDAALGARGDLAARSACATTARCGRGPPTRRRCS